MSHRVVVGVGGVALAIAAAFAGYLGFVQWPAEAERVGVARGAAARVDRFARAHRELGALWTLYLADQAMRTATESRSPQGELPGTPPHPAAADEVPGALDVVSIERVSGQMRAAYALNLVAGEAIAGFLSTYQPGTPQYQEVRTAQDKLARVYAIFLEQAQQVEARRVLLGLDTAAE